MPPVGRLCQKLCLSAGIRGHKCLIISSFLLAGIPLALPEVGGFGSFFIADAVKKLRFKNSLSYDFLYRSVFLSTFDDNVHNIR